MIIHERRYEAPSQSHIIKKTVIKQYPEGSTGWKFLFENHNKRNPDGSINLGEDFAQSISPYAKGFENNIEDSIKPLIFLLLKKGYYPYSSCEGHGKYPVGHVIIAFEDENKAIEFQKSLPWYVKYFMKIKFDRLYQPLTHQDVEGHSSILSVAEETDMFLNTMFKKNNTNWVSIQVRFSIFWRRFNLYLLERWIHKI